MNYRAIIYYPGTILKVVAAFLALPFATAICYAIAQVDSWECLLPFVYTALIFLGAGFLIAPKAPANRQFGAKEGLLIVGLSWIVISLIGALPYVFSGTTDYFNAVFETISGFTTTGATILDDIEAVPHGVLMWRSLTHWLGGMGILVFLLAVMPSSDGSTFQLMKFESPGPQVGKLVSKVRHSAAISYFIYLGLTVVQIVFLLAGGNSLFESMTLTFSTAGTGGFAVKNDSIAGYSVYTQIVLIVFMLIFSLNFNFYYLIVIGKISAALRNEEVISYLIYIVMCIAAVTACVFSVAGSFGQALLDSAFAVTSIASTTGFTTLDYAQWSEGARAILAITTVVGTCAGSTGGGLKFSRVIILFKTAGVSLLNALRPNSVHVVKLDGKPFGRNETESVTGFFLLSFLVVAGSVVLLCLFGNEFSKSFYTTITMFNNVGPCLARNPGALSSYYSFHPVAWANYASKTVMMLNMLIGRLEVYPILLLAAPQSWSRRF